MDNYLFFMGKSANFLWPCSIAIVSLPESTCKLSLQPKQNHSYDLKDRLQHVGTGTLTPKKYHCRLCSFYIPAEVLISSSPGATGPLQLGAVVRVDQESGECFAETCTACAETKSFCPLSTRVGQYLPPGTRSLDHAAYPVLFDGDPPTKKNL